MKNESDIAVVPPSESAANTEDTSPSIVLIGRTENEPLVSFETMTEGNFTHSGRPLDIASAKVDRLASFLQAVPSMVTAAEVTRVNYMEVVINGPLAAAKDGDGFRGFTRVGSSIKEHARLFDADRLRNLVQGGALLQIASVLVAQKHLADISEKLSDIKQGVDQIQEFQRDERKSRIVGTLDYLAQAAQAILHGEYSHAVRQQLEQCEVDLVCIQQHLFVELGKKIDGIATIKDPNKFGTSGLTNAIKGSHDELLSIYEQWALCVQARIAAWQILSAFPSEPQLLLERRISIQGSIDRVHGECGALTALRTKMRTKIHSLYSVTESQLSIAANKRMLEIRVKQKQAIFRSRAVAMKDRLQKGVSMLRAHQQPVRLAIRIEGGQITEARHLDATATAA